MEGSGRSLDLLDDRRACAKIQSETDFKNSPWRLVIEEVLQPRFFFVCVTGDVSASLACIHSDQGQACFFIASSPRGGCASGHCGHAGGYGWHSFHRRDPMVRDRGEIRSSAIRKFAGGAMFEGMRKVSRLRPSPSSVTRTQSAAPILDVHHDASAAQHQGCFQEVLFADDSWLFDDLAGGDAAHDLARKYLQLCSRTGRRSGQRLTLP